MLDLQNVSYLEPTRLNNLNDIWCLTMKSFVKLSYEIQQGWDL